MNLTGTQEKRTQVLKHHKDTLIQLQTGCESCLEAINSFFDAIRKSGV